MFDTLTNTVIPQESLSYRMSTVLEVRKLTKKFGGLIAIDELDFSVRDGEILGIIGPNGAGKTTLFNTISGFYPPTAGNIIYKGEDITGLEPYKVAAKGIVRTFQLTTLFSNYTVLQNLLVATHLESKLSLWSGILGMPAHQKRERRCLELASELLNFVGLSSIRNELAMNLPHGYQRSLGVAIALAANPRLLLLDEPLTGMNQEEIQSMIELIGKIHQSGVTVLLVEHNMKAVMGTCDRVVVLNFGRKITEGSCEEISRNEAVIRAYLGGGHVT